MQRRSYLNLKGRIKIRRQVLRCPRYMNTLNVIVSHTVNTTTDYQPVSFCVLQATVRMVINYKKTQKTILRVNPRVPLAELLPAICEKCEFDVETTILLKDVQSRTPLNLSNSLNDYAIREVYARDTQGECYYSKRPNSLVLHIGYPMCFLLYLSSLLVVSLLCVSRSALNLMLFDSTAQPATPVCPDSPSYAGISVSPHDRHQQSHHMSLCFYNSMFFGGCSLFLRNSHTGQR